MILIFNAVFYLFTEKEGDSAAASGFSDVKAGSWYYDEVTAMTASGWLSGYPDGSFGPDRTITGAEFCSIISRIKGLSPSSQTVCSHWAAGLLQAALDAGYYDYDELPPTGESYDTLISRQVAVSMLMRAFAPAASGDYNTESAKISDFSQLSGRYYNRVFAAYSEGIAQGDSQGNFGPLRGLTRAEACALIMRAVNRYGSSAGSQNEGAAENESGNSSGSADNSTDTAQPTAAISGGVSENGQLHVSGTALCNENNQPVVLHGMSSHGMQWYGDYASYDSIKATAQAGANLFRIAMYTAEGGYISNPSLADKTFAAADSAIKNDMYVIIDWHILSDGNPQTYRAQALEFFKKAAARYKDSPAVLYEICNEPNGNVSWEKDIKPYAQDVIAAIRAVDPDSVILVGSSTWSQDLDKAAQSPLTEKNVMYTCHFYAGTHTQWLRDRISAAMKAGLPVFVTEWGTSDASGSGGVYLEEAARWTDFMAANNISWANWSLCDKGESSAALVSGASPSGGYSQAELTESGKFVFSHF